MYKISIDIPQPFLQALDEMVRQSGAGSKEAWVKNVVRNFCIDAQIKMDGVKDLMEYQRRWMYLLAQWP